MSRNFSVAFVVLILAVVCYADMNDRRGKPPRCRNLACPLNYDPVCGRDGITYPNMCTLGTANCDRPPYRPVGLASRGECKRRGRDYLFYAVEVFKVVLFKYLDLMLIFQGETIRREVNAGVTLLKAERVSCRLQSITGYSHKMNSLFSTLTVLMLAVASYAATVPRCLDLNCPLHYDPMCGMDGVTYQNPCTLGIANCNIPPYTAVGLAYKGKCGRRLRTRSASLSEVASFGMNMVGPIKQG
ncbi:uncharacterized protein LOC131946309 [Physella acuta]|uniref:uncharacterized protein LOC131946309 n=1 Tax=Physella acuta TaxID=109671 RepID=UPI0027DAC074|nr:uncharacterized protein LOC131946309 [Physella acuta]